MSHIVLTEEQARVLAGADEGVELRDARGRTLAFFKPFSPEEAENIAEAKRRMHSPGPRVPSARVTAMMAKLNELDREGKATKENVEEVLRRSQAGEPL